MNIPPLVRQFIVAGSCHLAALTVGGVVSYPGVLLQQLRSNDTIIHLDLDNGSWIGSVHGLAGIPSFLMPFLMQCQGRKFTFLLSCILINIGWAFTYAAKNLITLIIGECFHGLGGHSLLTVSFLSMSEMIQPKYRNICLLLYGTSQAFGMSFVGIIGRYLHWKTAGIVMSCPIMLALILGLFWPESPSWLAFKGRFEECEDVFKRLRGTDKESLRELNALIHAQKENFDSRPPKGEWIKILRHTFVSKDFYKPSFHTMILVSIFYWTGGAAVIIYSSDITLKLTSNKNDHIKFIIDLTFFIGFSITTILTRFFSSKKVLLFSMFGSFIAMSLMTVVAYLQTVDMIPKDSMLGAYFMVCYMVVFSMGSNGIGFTIATELMPVKHRGIGGCIFVLCTCIFHSSSLKSFPYLCVYINLWGAFLLYAIYLVISGVTVYVCVPDTKNRTLQEIEEFYQNGGYKEKRLVCADLSARQRFLKDNGL
uniref:SFRICE_009219 n=1 Tax=Spodoptera frugiperda TaxID=7108 RepID=A0A2H1W2F0_SPOFR